MSLTLTDVVRPRPRPLGCNAADTWLGADLLGTAVCPCRGAPEMLQVPRRPVLLRRLPDTRLAPSQEHLCPRCLRSCRQEALPHRVLVRRTADESTPTAIDRALRMHQMHQPRVRPKTQTLNPKLGKTPVMSFAPSKPCRPTGALPAGWRPSGPLLGGFGGTPAVFCCFPRFL